MTMAFPYEITNTTGAGYCPRCGCPGGMHYATCSRLQNPNPLGEVLRQIVREEIDRVMKETANGRSDDWRLDR